MTQEEFKLALEAAYLAGFNASGEGYNAECPFDYHKESPANNRIWKVDRDNYIKEALAETEQEPVIDKSAAIRIATSLGWSPQRTWVGLTDEEILAVARNHYNPHQRAEISFARAIEAKLKEKNT